MSHIFEALQRAEEERSGGIAKQPAQSVTEMQAADLLQIINSEAVKLASESTAMPLSVREVEPEIRDFAEVRTLVPAPPEKARLVCLTDQGSLGAEKFRVLGLRLRHLRERRNLKRIVITSTIPSEGKSLIAANLALNQARSKILKTVLLDGDFRRPTLASVFGFDRNLAGLSECLRGERQLSDVVCKLSNSGLWFLPAGVTPENPIELMQTGRLKELLERLETFFDWIIIDTPPVLPLADTPLWMKLSDGVLMVVREGVSERKLLERAVELIDPSMMLGLVVNSCSRNELKYYYSRYGQTPNNDGQIPPEPASTG